MNSMTFHLFAILFYILSLTNINGQTTERLIADALKDYEMNKTDAAIKKLLLVLENDESYTEARILLGQIYIQENNPELAEEILKPAITLKTIDPELHFVLGIALFEQKKYRSSLDEMERVLKLDRENVNAQEVLALCYLNLGVADYNNGSLLNAKKKFRKSLELNDKNIQTYQNLTVTLNEMEEREKAINIAEKGLLISPRDRTLLSILIQLYFEDNRIEEALKPSQDFYKYYPNDIDGALRLAFVYRYLNKGDNAFGIYNELIEKYPSDQEIYDQYADLLILRKEYDDAIYLYQKLLLHTENNIDIYQKIAEIQLKENKLDAARLSLRKALKNNADTEIIFSKLAKTYLDQNKTESAISIYHEGLLENPSNVKLLLELAGIYEKINIDSAKIIYQQIEQVVPDSPTPSIRLAKLYENLNPKFASNYCERAIKLNAVDPYPYFLLAKLSLNELDTNNSILLFYQSITKSLAEVSKTKKIFLEELSKNNRMISADQLANVEDDATRLENLEKVLRSSLEIQSDLVNHFQFENSLREWSNKYPGETVLIEFMGKILERSNKSDHALSIYEQLIRTNPKVKEGHLGFARINEKRGELNEAALAYKRALTIDSKDPELYHKLITLGKITDKTNQLCEEWLLRVKREPENRVLLTNLRALLRLEGRKEDVKQISKMIVELENKN